MSFKFRQRLASAGPTTHPLVSLTQKWQPWYAANRSCKALVESPSIPNLTWLCVVVVWINQLTQWTKTALVANFFCQKRGGHTSLLAPLVSSVFLAINKTFILFFWPNCSILSSFFHMLTRPHASSHFSPWWVLLAPKKNDRLQNFPQLHQHLFVSNRANVRTANLLK